MSRSLPRCRIIAECCSNHGGDIDLAVKMAHTAFKAGADLVKFQAYEARHLQAGDKQRQWLEKAELTTADLKTLVQIFDDIFFSVWSDRRVEELRRLGLKRFKVGHADRWRTLWREAPTDEEWFVSYAWGLGLGSVIQPVPDNVHPLATIPLYPAPLTALASLPSDLDGYSDHTIGLDACKIMMARGVPLIEKHFSIEGCPRRQPWDMDETGLEELVTWAKTCAIAQQGTDKLERWEG